VVICLDPISNTAIIFYKWTEIFEEVIEGEGEDAAKIHFIALCKNTFCSPLLLELINWLERSD